jgi:hypothetical protein
VLVVGGEGVSGVRGTRCAGDDRPSLIVGVADNHELNGDIILYRPGVDGPVEESVSGVEGAVTERNGWDPFTGDVERGRIHPPTVEVVDTVASDSHRGFTPSISTGWSSSPVPGPAITKVPPNQIPPLRVRNAMYWGLCGRWDMSTGPGAMADISAAWARRGEERCG